MPNQKITFEMIMQEYEDIKPSHPEDYYDWRILLNYINRHKNAVQTAYKEGGVRGVLEMLYEAEDDELVPRYFGEAYDNIKDY